MIQMGIGLATAFVLPVFERLPNSVVLAVKESASPGSVGLMQFLVSAQVPAAFNASHRRNVPLRRRVVGASARPRGPGRGMAYASNTLGAIAGAVLVAGFVLVPALGVHA